MASTFFFSDSPFTVTSTDTVITYYSYNSRTTLTSFELGNEVTRIENSTFFGCTNLASVTIGSGVTSIGNSAFALCNNLGTVIINGNSLQVIEAGAFYGPNSLTEITIPNSLTSLGASAFRYCSNLIRVNFLGNAPSVGVLAFDGTPYDLKIYRYSIKSGWSSTFGGKDVLLIGSPLHKGLQTFGLAGFSKGKISIKKQNQTILKPYSIDGGSTVYDANNVYVFKGGSINTLGVIFDLTPAGTIGSADIISFNGHYYYKKTGGFIAAGWRDENSILADRSNTVIDPGTLIYFYPRSYKTTPVEVGAIIEKYNNPQGKVSLVSSCGYQNTSKLAQISGSDAPIGAVFNNIAFDYGSFASSCSSLGFDPATILNSLGGVNFSSNYVVIRAKTSSTINNDLISDLGGGIISITNVNPSGGAVNKYYRFFVMCREGWNTVRFYGVDYPI